jgi:nicotinamide riboside transporter PnuC
MSDALSSIWTVLYFVAGQPHPLVVVEVIAACCGLLGSLLLALKGSTARWGWLLFFVSNIGWITFSFGFGHWFLLIQQLGFTVTSVIGIWKWLIQPVVDKKLDEVIL